jgi:nicotinamidase-related amidase
MTPVAKATPGTKLLTPADHVLVMIDFQSQMAFATKSIDPVVLRTNAALVAHAAAGFKVPTILTTVAEKTFSGPMFTEITDAFPGQKMLDRTTMNTWEDGPVIENSASCWRACGPVSASSGRRSRRWTKASRCT